MKHIVIEGPMPMHIAVHSDLEAQEAIAAIAKNVFGNPETPLRYIDCGEDEAMASALAQLPPYTPSGSPEAIAAIKTARVAAIKMEAGKRITDRFPMWKQMNLRQQGGTECLAMDAWINSVRAVSNQLEVSLPSDFIKDDYWPK